MDKLKKIITFVFVLCLCTQGVCFADTEQTVPKTYSLQQAREDMEDYIALTRKKIKNNWYPPTDAFENSAIIVLTISKDGQLEKCYLSTPSQSESFNNSLIEAVQKVKYSPLPDSYRRKNVSIDYEFGMQRRTISK